MTTATTARLTRSRAMASGQPLPRVSGQVEIISTRPSATVAAAPSAMRAASHSIMRPPSARTTTLPTNTGPLAVQVEMSMRSNPGWE